MTAVSEPEKNADSISNPTMLRINNNGFSPLFLLFRIPNN
jgi:hypothetical protein